MCWAWVYVAIANYSGQTNGYGKFRINISQSFRFEKCDLPNKATTLKETIRNRLFTTLKLNFTCAAHLYVFYIST